MTDLTGPRGAPDILPPSSMAFQRIVRTAEDSFSRYGYSRIETPAFEHTEVFERTLDQSSDVVVKEMYTFKDRSDRSLTLRPEGTAPVMRAILEHNLHRGRLPVKLYYFSTSFRYERPQKGRQRAFHQLCVEAVGSEGPDIDAEVIELGARIFEVLEIKPDLLLNSIGHPECRAAYMPKLVAFLESHVDQLDPDCKRKTKTNPLRTFDCKVPSDRAILENAPLITDFLCDDCRAHYDGLKSLLASANIEFTEDPRLVRGLDYYTRTAFAFRFPKLGTQNEIGGGGRYDGLLEMLGGPQLPGIGFGLGADRILLALEIEDKIEDPALDVFVIITTDDLRDRAWEVVRALRDGGLSTDMAFSAKRLRGQFEEANRLGARNAVVLGPKEIAGGTYTVRNMSTGEEASVKFSELVGYLKGRK